MNAVDIIEGHVYHYQAKVHSGRGKMVQKYEDKRGTWWVVIHDAVRNKSVTVRPSQISKRAPRG